MPEPSVWLVLKNSLLGALVGVSFTLPRILGAFVILLIGWGIGKLIQWLVTRGLRAVHFNQLTEHAGINDVLERADINTGPAIILGIIAYWFVFLIAVNAAVWVLNIPALTGLMSAVILYLPRIFAALLVVVFGAWAASFLGRLTRGSARSAEIDYSDLLGSVIQGFALFFVFAIALDILGLPFPFLTVAFAIIVGGVMLAAAIAFGIGGREYASDIFAGRELRSFYHEGDRLVTEDVEGTVKTINLTYTVLNTTRGDITVPNRILMHQHPMKPYHSQDGGISEAA